MEEIVGVEWKPRPYQERAVQHLIEMGCGTLWLKPGYGKTSICLETITRLRGDDPRPVLVVCPLRPAYTVWPYEAQKWSNFNHLEVVVLHGKKKDELFKKPADIYVINYDGLKWLQTKLCGKSPYSIMVVDEIPAFKDTGTQRFAIMKGLVELIPRRWGLTGTPASDSLMDLFGQQYIIDRGATFGRFFTHFRNAFFYNQREYVWVLKNGAEELIYDKLADSCLRIHEDDLLDLPPLIENDVHLNLPDDARKIYREMERALFSEIEAGSITAVNTAVSTMKLSQIANGGIYLDNDSPEDERRTEHLHQEKITATRAIVDEIGGTGAIIVYQFRHDLERLRAEFPDAPVMGGGTKPADTVKYIDEWNAGKHPVLLAHAQSIGHGLNMQEFGTDVIWHSITYSRDLYEQLNARLHRSGNTRKHVMVHRLIMLDTVDEDIIRALASKGATQEALLEGVRRRQVSQK